MKQGPRPTASSLPSPIKPGSATAGRPSNPEPELLVKRLPERAAHSTATIGATNKASLVPYHDGDSVSDDENTPASTKQVIVSAPS